MTPYLVVLAVSDDLRQPSSRHLLGGIDEVHFGRGERGAVRTIVDGRRILTLTIPDAKMSSRHGRLLRAASTWVLSDPGSKTGSVVDGELTRQRTVADGSILELGHTFLLFGEQQVEQDAADDVVADPAWELPSFVGPLAEGFAVLRRLARTHVPIHLLGERGTGKDTVARAIHAISGRFGAFVAATHSADADCVRRADGGTLYIDDIAAPRPVARTVRLCTTSINLTGQFDRADELVGFTLELPPLRERRADFGLILHALAAELPALQLSPAALRTLLAHPWPHNIRALQRTLTTAVALAPHGRVDLIHLIDLPRLPPPSEAAATPAAPRRAADVELRERLVGLLTAHRGNVVAVSREIGTRRTQVYRWARRFGLELAGFRR